MSKPQSQKEIISPTPQPTPNTPLDETANWKTYRGKYFSFKYPGSWREKILEPSQNPKYSVTGSTFLCSFLNIFTASVSDISSYPTLQSYLTGRWTGAVPTKTVVLDGLPANYYEDPGDPGSSNPAADIILYSPSKGIVVDLYFVNSCGVSFQQIKTELVSITSTFKFTK